jgi:RNA polymerase sigma-70 factor (ECF subfamily)
MPTKPAAAAAAPDDTELIGRIAQRDEAAFEQLMRRHNGRLFRVARSILRNDEEAEDAVQEAYLSAYRHAAGFNGAAAGGTWLTRIVINQCLMRARSEKRHGAVIAFTPGAGADSSAANDMNDLADRTIESPAAATLRGEIRRLVEQRLDELPGNFRTVFVMRDIEDMTVEETAQCLSIPPATVRTRLFRARALLREALARDIDAATLDVFGFAGSRCDRIVATVLSRCRD